MKHVVQMFWNVDEWNMTQSAEFLAFGAKCWACTCNKIVWIPINFCVRRGEWNWQNWMLLWVLFTLYAVFVIITRCFLFVSFKETLLVKGCISIQCRRTLLILDRGLAFFNHVLKIFFYWSLLFILLIHISIVLCSGVNKLKMQCSVAMVVSC